MTNSEKKRLVTLNDEEKDTNFGVTVDHEFSCRALHWQDVAEFERKELSKVRVHHALRAVSTALAALAVVAASMGVLDVELYYLAQGRMIPPIKLRNYQINCSFTWANLTVQYSPQTVNRLQTFLLRYSQSYRIIVSLLTLATVSWRVLN